MVSAQPILVVVLMVMMIVLLKVHRKHGDGTSSVQYSSVQFSCLVVSDSLWPHELQHARPPCASPTPGVYSNSCPSSQRCHPTVSSSVVSFSSHLQSLLASGFFFPVSQFFSSGGQSIGVSASSEYSSLISFRMDWLDLLAVQGTLKSLLLTPQFKSINSLALSFLYWSHSHIPTWLLEKP